MAIYDQSYTPWAGEYAPRLSRFWAMVQMELAHPFRNIWVMLTIGLAYMIVGSWLLVLFLILSALPTLSPGAPIPMDKLFALGNNLYRDGFFNFYHDTSVNFSLLSMILMVLSATVGASLISRDLRYNALLMYFSRSITRADYLAGKFVALVLFLQVVTLGPALVLFVGQLGMGAEKTTAWQQLGDLGSISLHSLILVIPMSAVVLAFSSLTKRAYLAGILWATFFFSSWIFSSVLTGVLKEDWCLMLSWMNLTAHLGNYCYVQRLPSRLPPVLSCGWLPPLVMLGSVTLLSLAVVWRRLGSVEAGE
jgi:ABC-type transport system involved in multi-copper enzyme maturation permease subunit